MALEHAQGLHNRILSAIANLSGSNDPAQIPNDAIGTLQQGARSLAGETERISDSSRAGRRNRQREEYRNREARRATWEQSQKTLRNEGFEVDQPDTDLMTEMEVDPFGQDQSDYYEYDQNDKQYEEQQRNKLREALLDAKETGNKGLIRELNQELRLNPEEVPVSAPKSVMRDALTQLQSGTDAFGYDAFPGSRDVESSLEDQLRNNIELDRSLGRDTVIADRANYSPLRAAYNNVTSQIEAESLLREGIDGSGEASLKRAPDLVGLGTAKSGMGQKVQTSDPIVGEAVRRMGVGSEARYLDPKDGTPLSIQGPELPTQMLATGGTPNNLTTSTMFNAPQSARDWVEANVPDYRDNGRTFGDYPQTDITLATTNFANRLRELEGYGMENVSQNIRSTDELQRVVDHVVGVARQKGDKMYNFDAETGKNVLAQEPDIRSVMNRLRMNEGDQTALAGALAQLEMAKQMQVNQAAKSAYQNRTGGATPRVVFDAPEAINPQGGAARIATQKKGSSIRTGTTTNRRGEQVGVKTDIKTAMGQLSDPDAARPFIGAVNEDRPATSSFKGDQIYNRTGETTPEGIEQVLVEKAMRNARKTGKPVDVEGTKTNIRNAQFVQERADRAARDRSQRESEIMSSLLPSDQRMRRRFGR